MSSSSVWGKGGAQLPPPDIWGVVASFMPIEGEGEGFYRLAQVHRSMIRPDMLTKARRRVLRRLFFEVNNSPALSSALD
jgi:hypothetical protein